MKGKIAYKFREEMEISRGNRVLVKKCGEWIEANTYTNIKVDFCGNNSLLKIHENVICKKELYINMGEGAYVELGEGFKNRFQFAIDARGKNSTIVFGKNANIGNGGIYAGDEENLEVIIGDGFMSATDLYIRNSDGHTIFNIENGEVINMPRFGIHIGNHVWCGYSVTILKDVVIPNNCIVAACSTVLEDEYQENCIIGGMPAHIIKTGINWDSKCIKDFMK